jgi:hypothetical protein
MEILLLSPAHCPRRGNPVRQNPGGGFSLRFDKSPLPVLLESDAQFILGVHDDGPYHATGSRMGLPETKRNLKIPPLLRLSIERHAFKIPKNVF